MPASAHATTSDGVRLALHLTPAAGPRRAVVVMVHAMMANASYLRGAAGVLASRGVDCWAVDLRGHGESVPPRADAAGWTFEDYVERDLPAALAEIRRRAGQEVDYLGHSLGGLAGLAAFGTGTTAAPRRLVLVAVNVWRLAPAGDLRRRAQLLGMDAISRLVGRLPVRRLGLGTDDEPHVYLRGLRRWAWSGRWPYDDAMPRIASPTLVVAAEADPYCAPHEARAHAEPLAGPVTHRIVGRLRGDADESDHFGFFVRPSFRETLWPDVADFLTR